MSQKLIVAGGGIGGMATALALHRAGLEVTVFERAPVFSEVGTGLSLWPNATRVLQSLGVLDEIAARGEAVTQFNLQRPDGSRISTIAMTGYSTPALCVHRADLHRALFRPLPARGLEAGQVMQSFTEDEDGVTARLASGREVRADGLIGADGINSVIRAQLHGAAPPVYRGYTIWRGLAPDPGGLIRGHLSETWGAGQRFGIMPIGQGRICWYATRNGPAAQPDAPEGRQAEVLGLYRGWHRPITALIEATAPADILRNDARDRNALRPWGRGRVTLVGDAAHPITPNVGQGACLAIEDAAWLAKLLPETADVAGAFRAYERMRGARTDYIARQARRIGSIGQWENPWLVQGRNFIARLVLARQSVRQLNAVYAYKV
jgi:2-polyprenyl-6-methoxyphenol hydroxylase-like FAD-dependent oxidoreductase